MAEWPGVQLAHVPAAHGVCAALAEAAGVAACEVRTVDAADRFVVVSAGEAQPLGRGKHDLHRGLKARQVTMIAIGGAIGTGLIIGT